MFDEATQEKYVIAALGKGYAYNSLTFWGKDSCGYYQDLSKCEFYTKQEAYRHATSEDIPIKIKDLMPYIAMHVEHAYEPLNKATKEYNERRPAC